MQCYMSTVILPTCTYVLKYVLMLRVAGQCMCNTVYAFSVQMRTYTYIHVCS